MDDIVLVWDLNGVIFKKYQIDSDTMKIVKRLSELGHTQYIFTNTKLKRFREIYPVLMGMQYFKNIFSTVENHTYKPSPKAYRFLLRKIQNKVIYFIDDSPKNIQVAQRHGIKGIRYTNDIQLIEDLKLLNLYHDN